MEETAARRRALALLGEASVDMHPFYLFSVLLLWVAVYHVAFWSVAIARDPALICWSVGIFGLSVVSPRQPPARRLLLQLVAASLAIACTSYTSLYLLRPAPIAGLDGSTAARAAAALMPAAVLSLAHLIGVVRDLRQPLWGEARVLTGVQRSLASGARLYFTPAGRDYLRERFGATPDEFLNMVRY